LRKQTAPLRPLLCCFPRARQALRDSKVVWGATSIFLQFYNNSKVLIWLKIWVERGNGDNITQCSPFKHFITLLQFFWDLLDRIVLPCVGWNKSGMNSKLIIFDNKYLFLLY
jgi:hypothetical protein